MVRRAQCSAVRGAALERHVGEPDGGAPSGHDAGDAQLVGLVHPEVEVVDGDVDVDGAGGAAAGLKEGVVDQEEALGCPKLQQLRLGHRGRQLLRGAPWAVTLHAGDCRI